MQRFNVVVRLPDGGTVVRPMKEWLRHHPEHLPAGMGPQSTSHQLRAALKKRGWRVEESSDEVRLVMPGSGLPVATVQRLEAANKSPPSLKPWSWEGNVVRAVCTFLESTNWIIDSVADTESGQAGADIKAHRGNRVLIVEAKGYPSTTYERGSQAGQPKPTNPGTQARHWVAEAIMAAMLRQSAGGADHVALAFPDFPVYTKLLARLQVGLGQLGLHVVIVTESGAVVVSDSWPQWDNPPHPA